MLYIVSGHLSLTFSFVVTVLLRYFRAYPEREKTEITVRTLQAFVNGRGVIS